MSWIQASPKGSNHTNTSPKYYYNSLKKPIEIYVFVDPLCPECWELESYLQKFCFEYGRFFIIRRITCSHLGTHTTKKLERSKKTYHSTAQSTKQTDKQDSWNSNSIIFPWISVATKAAELQGKNAGKTFLRKIREYYFLRGLDVLDERMIIQCAIESKLDVQEFRNDLYSNSVKKAIHYDLKTAKEMNVQSTPAVVFFNQLNEEQGVKVSGLYSYDVYVSVLKEMLQKDPIPSVKPPLEEYLSSFEIVAKSEISIVYDWSLEETNKHMKRLKLKQKVKKLIDKNEIYYKFIH